MSQSVEEMIEKSGLNKNPNEIYAEYVQNTKKPPVSNSLRWRFIRLLKRRAFERVLDKSYDPRRTLTQKEVNAVREEMELSHLAAFWWWMQCAIAVVALFGTGAAAFVGAVAFTVFFAIHVIIVRAVKRSIIPPLFRYLGLPFTAAEYALVSFSEQSMKEPNARLENEECFVELEPMHTVVSLWYQSSLRGMRWKEAAQYESDRHENNLNVLRQKKKEAVQRIRQFSQVSETNPSLLQRVQEWLQQLEEAIDVTERAESAIYEIHEKFEEEWNKLEALLWNQAQHMELDLTMGEYSGGRDEAEHDVNVWLNTMREHVHTLYQSLEETPILEAANVQETETYTPLMKQVTDQLTHLLNTNLPKGALEPTS